MEAIDLEIPASDGCMLSAVLFKPSSNIKGVIQFHPGTVTAKKFYSTFCKYFAENGYAVISFDYRGIGKSRPRELNGFNGKITHWGMYDMTGILNWVTTHFPHQKKYIIAHSMGGQVLGLMNNHQQIDKILTIASSYGNWRNYSGINKYSSAVMWILYIPLAIALFGYLPLKIIRMGEDLPKGAAWELWKWCINNYPYSKIMDKASIEHFYHEINKPFKAYFIEDDNIATKKTILHYQSDFDNTNLDIEIIRPEQVDADKIGHYGFFKERFKDTLWKKALHWLENNELVL